MSKKSSLRRSLSQIFSFESWLSRSARADYLLMVFNGMLMVLLSPKLLGNAAVASMLFSALHDLFNGRALIGADIPAELIAAGFTLFLFMFDDFTRFLLHRWLHTSPLLWSFHKVHHSATSLNPFTVFRTHPIEAILFSLRGALVQGTSVAIFIYFFGSKVTLVSVLGASVFNFMFNALGANLRHSNESIGFWVPVERIFMSPAQHHIHHSYAPEHINKNFGVVFSFWDIWFGTHCHSANTQSLRYGISEVVGESQHSLKNLYLSPFIELGTFMLNKFKITPAAPSKRPSGHTHYKGSL